MERICCTSSTPSQVRIFYCFLLFSIPEILHIRYIMYPTLCSVPLAGVAGGKGEGYIRHGYPSPEEKSNSTSLYTILIRVFRLCYINMHRVLVTSSAALTSVKGQHAVNV